MDLFEAINDNLKKAIIMKKQEIKSHKLNEDEIDDLQNDINLLEDMLMDNFIYRDKIK